MAADCLTDTRSHPGEKAWSPWRLWEHGEAKNDLDTFAVRNIYAHRHDDVIDEAHSISTRMTNFLLDAPSSGLATPLCEAGGGQATVCSSQESDNGLSEWVPSVRKTLSAGNARRYSLTNFDGFDGFVHSDIPAMRNAPHDNARISPPGQFSAEDQVVSFGRADRTGHGCQWLAGPGLLPGFVHVANHGAFGRAQSPHVDIWGPPSAHSSPGQVRALSPYSGVDVWEPHGVMEPNDGLTLQSQRRALKLNGALHGGPWKCGKRDQRRNSFYIRSFDIDKGLCIPELASIPSVNGYKVARFFSQTTKRRTVVSLMDTAYLMPNKQQEGQDDYGFLTFHDCVELRSLMTGMTLTRNQRNNLRKRLAMTAHAIVQVDLRQLQADLHALDCFSPGAYHHHAKINAYLLTPTVAQVILCTRETDQCYKGQSLAVQTLFDLCKNDNAGGALREFIRSQPDLDLNVRDFKGMCPIHYAAKGGYKDTVEALLETGVDVNVMDKSDQCPLHYAIYNGHRDVQFQLLEAGAHVHTSNISGNTLLHVAAYHNQLEVAAAILARCPELKEVRNLKFNSTPLQCALHKGLTDMASLLSSA